MADNPSHCREYDPPTVCEFTRATEKGPVTEWFVRLPGGTLISCGCATPEPYGQGRGVNSRDIAEWLVSCMMEWRR